MSTTYDDPVLQIADLADRPGKSRQVDLTLAVPDQLALALVEVTGPVRLDGVLESVVDGLLVRGRLDAPARMSCARCLRGVVERVETDVVELFADERRVPAVDAGDDAAELDPGYEIRDGHIDLDTLVRDAIMPSLPYQPLCRDDCAGLCTRCGTNLNERRCDCVDVSTDPRWAPLAGLRLPEG